MTQAFNLSQLANFVNTSGQLNAATGLFNQVPVANGGTGRSSVTAGALVVGAGTSAMTELTGTTAGTVVVSSPVGWTSAPAASVAGGNYQMETYTSPSVWTKPSTLKGVKVTVVGAGGNTTGGNTPTPGIFVQGGGGGGGAAICYFDAPAIPGSPITITAGAGTNSFGSLASATAGADGGIATASPATVAGGVGGTGTVPSPSPGGALTFTGQTGGRIIGNGLATGNGGSSMLGIGGATPLTPTQNGTPGVGYGAGGSGVADTGTAVSLTRGVGTPGVVIIEEFY